MASYNQPIETLPIFDNAVFSANTTVLTLAQANLLYLKKTVPDTATALETFNGGIITNSIQTSTTGSSLNLATTSLSGAINIGTSSISGIINIGTALGRTGNINIGLLTGQTTSYNVVIGSSGKSFVTLNGSTVTLNGDVTVNGTLSNVDTTSSLTLGTLNATDVKISKTGSNTAVNRTLGVASTLTATGGITMGANSNITLPTTITSPTSFTMLGGTSTTNYSVSIGSSPANGVYAMTSVQITNSGTYLLTFLLQVTYTVAFNYFYTNILLTDTAQTLGTVIPPIGSSPLISVNWGQQPLGNVGSLFMTSNGSYVFTATTNKYYNLALYISGGGSIGSPNGYFTLTRLA